MPKAGEIKKLGRPPKGRALTEILERVGGESVEMVIKDLDGTSLVVNVIPNELLARMLWSGIMTRKITFPGDEEATNIAMDEWLDLAKFIYVHVDDKATSNIDHGGTIEHVFSVEEWKETRKSRLAAVAELPEVCNDYNADNIVNVRAVDVEDVELMDKYEGVEFGLAEEDDDDDT